MKLNPGNQDAKVKLSECQKVVRQLQFFAAIEVGDEPSAAEGLDVESMVVNNDYDGVRLGDEMTQEFIDDMTERFKNGKKIHMKYVYQIILAVTKVVHAEPTMKEVMVPDDTKLTVCGDTHGEFVLPFSPPPSCPFCVLAAYVGWLTLHRPILRPHGAVPAERPALGKAMVPLQRRFRGPRLLVH